MVTPISSHVEPSKPCCSFFSQELVTSGFLLQSYHQEQLRIQNCQINECMCLHRKHQSLKLTELLSQHLLSLADSELTRSRTLMCFCGSQKRKDPASPSLKPFVSPFSCKSWEVNLEHEQERQVAERLHAAGTKNTEK